MVAMEEQETTVTQLRNRETRIYTANAVHLRRRRNESRAREVDGGARGYARGRVRCCCWLV